MRKTSALTPGPVILAAVEEKSARKPNENHILSFIINTHESIAAAACISAGVKVGAEAKRGKNKENSVYDEKNQIVILSVEVIVMQARSDFESHNYTECEISQSK